MTQLQISLPDEATRYVEDQVASGRYQSPSEFISQLIEHARVQAAKERLAELIREGMESGEGEEPTDEYWERFDAKLAAEFQGKRTA